MPHVDIKCFSGRTEEQKRKCANQIAEVIANTLGCETKSVSVAIKDVEQYFDNAKDFTLVNCISGTNPKKDIGQSPLQVALKNGSFDIAEYLIGCGANINFMEADTFLI